MTHFVTFLQILLYGVSLPAAGSCSELCNGPGHVCMLLWRGSLPQAGHLPEGCCECLWVGLRLWVKRSKTLCCKGWTVVVNLMELKCTMYFWFSTDGDILCHGYATRVSWTTWTVYCMFIQCSSQVHEFLLRCSVCVKHLFFSISNHKERKKPQLLG